MLDDSRNLLPGMLPGTSRKLTERWDSSFAATDPSAHLGVFLRPCLNQTALRAWFA
jgi:hypothetical protein